MIDATLSSKGARRVFGLSLHDWENWMIAFLIIAGLFALLAGVATWVVVQMQRVEIAESNERAARLGNETEQLKADNLALQTSMLPRNVGLIGINGPPPAQEWFSEILQFPGTVALIQSVDEPEAMKLANELAIVLQSFGWKPQRIDNVRSKIWPSGIQDGINVSYPTGKPWTAEEPTQPWFTWARAAEALANCLTKAGLGVGAFPVSRFGFSNVPENITSEFGVPRIPYFSPPLEGVYVQVGARPIAATIAWIKAGRPNAAGVPTRALDINHK